MTIELLSKEQQARKIIHKGYPNMFEEIKERLSEDPEIKSMNKDVDQLIM